MNEISLIPIEHHHGLAFCWNLNRGLEQNVDVSRLKPYVDWFYQEHLKDHFKVEESVLFPILGMKNGKVMQAIGEHKRLRTLCKATTEIEENIKLLAKELDYHVKYEERFLFPEIAKFATPEQLKLLERIHEDVPDADDWDDQFWL